jgi:hypothetical protein
VVGGDADVSATLSFVGSGGRGLRFGFGVELRLQLSELQGVTVWESNVLVARPPQAGCES